MSIRTNSNNNSRNNNSAVKALCRQLGFPTDLTKRLIKGFGSNPFDFNSLDDREFFELERTIPVLGDRDDWQNFWRTNVRWLMQEGYCA